MNIKSKVYTYSILDILFLIFTSIIVIFFAISFSENPYKLVPIIVFFALYILIFLVRYLRKKKIYRWLTFAYPLIYLMGIFESFFMIIPSYNTNRYDQLFTSFDFKLLGVNPTVWIEQFHHPVLTDVLYFLYFLYFPLQFFILIYLYRKSMFRAMESAIFILLLCNFGAYISYFHFPALGPRFFLESLHTYELNGVFLAKPIVNVINMLEPNKLDAFPSLHTAVLIISLLLMHRYNKKMLYYLLLPSVGILVSLVYCRYHYVFDMIAGAIWAIVSFVVGTHIYNKYYNRLISSFY